MSKKILEDVTPPKRSIRQIELSPARERERDREHERRMEREALVAEKTAHESPIVEPEKVSKPANGNDRQREGGSLVRAVARPDTVARKPLREKKKLKRGHSPLRRRIAFVVLGLIACAIAIFLALNFLFAGAEVVITPRQEEVRIEGTFEAYREPVGPLDLPYEVMVVRKELERTLPATGEEFVEERAVGKATIFNNYDGNPLRLVANTRFESPSGLIFRIHSAVVVPARLTAEGAVVPGSVEVELFADAPGEEYNIDPTRLTLPGLAGDARFNEVYAELSEAMHGGHKGVRRTVASDTAEATRDELRRELQSELVNQAHLEKPPGFILFEGATNMVAHSLPDRMSDDGVVIGESVALEATVFKETDLARFVARQTIAAYDNGDVMISNPETLVFELLPAVESATSGDSPLAERESISFSLSGMPRIVWTFDAERLRADLAGTSKTEEVFIPILSGYPGILSGRAYIRPFWQKSFPKDEGRITVVTEGADEN